MTNPNMLIIEVVASPDDAPNYNRDTPDVRAVDITKAIIVLNGMASGASTVDFQIRDQQGGEYVAMLTGALVKQLAGAIVGAESR